jgi:CoA-transferase family III
MLTLAELTGFADGPPLEPSEALIERIRALGRSLGIEPLPLLTERADIWSYGRNGRVSCGGATRLMATADGWLALSLARPDDESLVPAWIGCDASWPDIESVLRARPTTELVERGRLLGLPLAGLGERAPGPVVRATRLGDAPPLAEPPRVVDLSALWAGPLCTRLLRDRGARVVKVESTTRPDGARRGPAEFFDRLHHGKEFLSIDFQFEEVRDVLSRSDVVIEGSRPRALEQLGIRAEELVERGPRVWVSITGHGRTAPQRDWVGFGDDAAVAGGLVAWWQGAPCFFGDAIADPLTGVAAAAAVVDALRQGGRWLIDCNLAGVAAHVAGGDTVSWSAA